ncbi:Uncharacterised protein [Mycobacteroides abscessus subsp. abscessus]|nr:Uncharacterised protein [Mycobacteroides abscessus subsp. abscessus]
MPASIDRVNQSGAAPAAVQAAGQILQMLPFPVAAASIGGEAVLHLLEGALVDEWFVIAGIFDAAQAGSANVKAIREHLVGMAALYGALRLFRGGTESQSTVLQQCGQTAQRHVRVGCVGVEGPPDVVGSLGIDRDLPGFAAVDRRANIYVPNGSPSNAAAVADFLFHPFEDFLSKVGAVEVSNGREDAMDELALRSFVDVLGDRHELGASLANCQIDGDVVSAVAGEAVNLVNEDDVNIVVPQVAQHRLQLGPVDGAARFAGVGELHQYFGANGAGLGRNSPALGRYGKAFGEPATTGLILG